METLPLPAFNCEAKVNNRLCLTLSFSSSFARIRICGRQFFVWGGPSSSRSNENLAAERASPRIPSPHSFSALMLNKFNVKIFRNLGKFKKVMNFMREISFNKNKIMWWIESDQSQNEKKIFGGGLEINFFNLSSTSSDNRRWCEHSEQFYKY